MIRGMLNLRCAVLVTLLALACSVCGVLVGCRKKMPESQRATKEVEAFLTETYGAEARKIIENSLWKWFSLEAHKDPTIRLELATEQFFSAASAVQLSEALQDEPFWRVTKSVVVESVRVLEYSPERFKAVACVVEQFDKITTAGAFVESLPTLEYQNVYVFVRENNTWKLAGTFNISRPNVWRDWEYAPDWLKETIGDLPDWEPCHK